MATPCEQQPVINEILQVVSALKSLPETLNRMHGDFREAINKMQQQAEDARETRAILQQLRETIQSLQATDHEQWDALEAVRQDLGKASTRSGERLEALEKWQGIVNGGDPNGLMATLKTLIEDRQRRVGRSILFTGVPWALSILAIIVALMK